MLKTTRGEAELKDFSQGRNHTIGLLGAGTVGGGLIKLIEEKLSHHSLPLRIKRVGVRDISKARSFSLPASLLSDDLESIVEDPEIDIVVEAMGGLEPARTYIEKALLAGKHVVTANKYVVSECGDYLQRLADSKGKLFFYEASVAGSIPIIEILREGVIPDKINSIYAILNSTTHFIVSRMGESQEGFQSALVKAQELGFAEPDPTFDISGKDASQKLSILISLLKNQYCPPAQIHTRGIESLTPIHFQFAEEHQWIIKPLAIYEESQSMGFASVEPVMISKNSIFANARNEYNALCFDCQNIGKQILIGKGAGELPTASAVLSDLKKIVAVTGSGRNRRDQVAYEQWSKFPQLGPMGYGQLFENLKPYRFYVSCAGLEHSSDKLKIRESFAGAAELVQETGLRANCLSGLSIVTKRISHADLDRILNSVKAHEVQVQTTWLKVMEDI